MENVLRKGRALQLDGIMDNPVKVTLGFKCEGHDKIALANEAHKSEMTLSEYVEYIVSMRHAYKQASLISSQDITSLKQEAVKRNDEILQLKQKLAFYEENKDLQRLLANYKGQTTTIRDFNSTERTITISKVADIFEVVVSTFKTR